MTTSKYPVAQIEQDGARCIFFSLGCMRDGWIMPDGVGVDYAGYAQLRFDPEEISTADREGLRRARIAVASGKFNSSDFGYAYSEVGGWIEDGDSMVRTCYTGQGLGREQLDFKVSFGEGSARPTTINVFNITAALKDDAEWTPMFTAWRHGGWYVNNVRHPSGAVGCVSNKFEDKKWRIVCDPRRVNLGEDGDITFKSRVDAAKGERDLIQHEARQILVSRSCARSERLGAYQTTGGMECQSWV